MSETPTEKPALISVTDVADALTPRVERAIDRWGMPTVLLIAMCVFFYMLYTGKLQAIETAQASTLKAVEALANDTRFGQAEQRWLLRQICLHTAETESERAGCVSPSDAR
jgi:hypothetical protein